MHNPMNDATLETDIALWVWLGTHPLGAWPVAVPTPGNNNNEPDWLDNALDAAFGWSETFIGWITGLDLRKSA